MNSEDCTGHIKPHQIEKISQRDKGTRKKKRRYIEVERINESNGQIINNIQHCEYKECQNDVISTCFECGCLLCCSHISSEDCINHCAPPVEIVRSNDEKKGKKRTVNKGNWNISQRKHSNSKASIILTTKNTNNEKKKTLTHN